MITKTGYFSKETSQRSPILLWQSAGQDTAAATRLKLLSGIKSQPAEIDKEFPNIRVSINWLIKQQDRSAAELILAYVETLESYLHLRGQDFELANWCLVGLSACEKLRRNPSRILLILGNAQYALGQWEQADTSWQAALSASREKDQVIYAHTTFALGRLQINQGKYKMALKTLARAEKLLSAVNETQAIIGVRSEIAAYYLNRRELEKALSLYLEIDEYYKKNVMKQSSNHILLMLGVVYRQKRIFDKAISYLSELCQRGETQKDISSLATATHHLAWVYFELKELGKARYLCGKALALYDDLQDPRGLSDGYEQLGAILLDEGKHADAINFLEQSVQIRQQIGNHPGFVSSLRRLALAHILSGNHKLARKLLIEVLIRYLRLGILSRQRVLSLSRDFMAGIGKVIIQGIKKSSHSLEHSPSKSAESVMESFSRSLAQPPKIRPSNGQKYPFHE